MKPTLQSSARPALEIVQKLRDAGHTALLAGGCVRDMVLGRDPKDYDVATDARPERVAALFPKARLVGAKFGVVLVRKAGQDIEVATFRADGPYSDGRHPDSVTYGTEQDDARRRDFTINGLFYDPAGDRLIDYVDGQRDLAARVIRTIGDPDRRFAEDHLRMLRAVRFSAKLGFPIEPQTAESIRAHAASLATISPERIWMELEQILVDPSRETAWGLLTALGLAPHLAPGWRPPPAEAQKIARRLGALTPAEAPATLALATLFHAETPRRVEEIGRSMRLSNRLIDTTAWLVASLPIVQAEDRLELADLKTLMAGPAWDELLDLARVDCQVGSMPLQVYDRVRARAAAIPDEQVAPPPLLSGDDLSAMGVMPGPRFGEIVRALYRAQLNEQITTEDHARALAVRLIGQQG